MTVRSAERRRDAGEYFGFERLLWDDRDTGTLSARYQTQLADAERELAAVVKEVNDGVKPAETERNRALLDAIRVARSVLAAAREALRERGSPVLGPRA